MDTALEVLATVNRLFAAVQPVSRAQFDAFAGPMPAANPHVPPRTAGGAAGACISGAAAMTGQYEVFLGNARRPGFHAADAGVPAWRAAPARGGRLRAGGRLHPTVAFSSAALSPQELEARRLEAEEPGITRVRRDSDGAIYLD
jgi:hypothetical protein